MEGGCVGGEGGEGGEGRGEVRLEQRGFCEGLG